MILTGLLIIQKRCVEETIFKERNFPLDDPCWNTLCILCEILTVLQKEKIQPIQVKNWLIETVKQTETESGKQKIFETACLS